MEHFLVYLRDIIKPSSFQRSVFPGAESPLLTHADEAPCHFTEAGLKICLKANIQISLMQPGSVWWMWINGCDTRVFFLRWGRHMCESLLMLSVMTAEEPSKLCSLMLKFASSLCVTRCKLIRKVFSFFFLRLLEVSISVRLPADSKVSFSLK